MYVIFKRDVNIMKRYKYHDDLRKSIRLDNLVKLKNYRKKSNRNLKLSVGAIVIVCAKEKKHWPLGKVLQLFPGNVGIVRFSKLRTKFGEILPPAQRLSLLEVYISIKITFP